jgi:diaminopimelate decarboxylase/aspartate kinase
VPRPWVVLKYGGTSVARAENWARIAERARQVGEGRRVLIVASALAGVSNGLERAVAEALAGKSGDEAAAIRDQHRRLGSELGLDDEAIADATAPLDDLETWLDGIRKTGEASPRLVARVMAVGELASTRLGVAALARQGVEARWIDAREALVAAESGETDHDRYLETDVTVRQDPEVVERLAPDAGVVLTQGFIARNTAGETCLLGRGGSDTSAALFAALVGAEELEIWSDVHGLFTADPRQVPVARLIRRIGYREAQELAAMGAKVLHPRCLRPLRRAGIPLSLHSVADADGGGTRIEADDEEHPAVTAVTSRTGVTMITISTLDMWRTSGFLARVFAPFEELGMSVDLVATSQSAVSMTLDRVPGGIDGSAFARLIERLEKLGRVEAVHPCGVVSVVGRRIRAALHELGPAMEVFQERPVLLVSDSSEDLNLSFVVDEPHTAALTVRLHDRLFPAQGGDPRLGSTWEVLEGKKSQEGARGCWWREAGDSLQALVADGKPRYVYHLPTVERQARRLRGLQSVGQVYYSMKANAHPRVLETVAGAGLGIECVSAAELLRAREVVGSGVPLLFTPNFCPMEEYRTAFQAGAEVTIDGPEPFENAPDLFRGNEVAVRIDPGQGRGHHAKVFTAGARAKFGHPKDDIARLAEAAAANRTKIVGVHAHVGSGILDSGAWYGVGSDLAPVVRQLPDVRWVDLGGGLGVIEHPGQPELDLAEVDRTLATLAGELGGIELRLEPGRYLISEAGVLVSPVTQVRRKGEVRFIGTAAGMNAFLRPALYGAWHGIHNLSRLDETPSGYWNVVGPICETSDVLGTDRLLPETLPGDVLLIENAGAYGIVMASRYNFREPPEEVVLES